MTRRCRAASWWSDNSLTDSLYNSNRALNAETR